MARVKIEYAVDLSDEERIAAAEAIAKLPEDLQQHLARVMRDARLNSVEEAYYLALKIAATRQLLLILP